LPTHKSTAEPETIGFGADGGGYTVHVAGTRGYRADTAVAKISRETARKFPKARPAKYNIRFCIQRKRRLFKTVGAMENTFPVWALSVPFIQSIPISDPYGFSISALRGLMLDAAQQLALRCYPPRS